MTFSPEQLNFFKFSTVVLDEFPVALRQVFVFMWDNLVASVPKWDDSVVVRNMFLMKEGGKTKYVPTSKSIKEWDCTALFEATIFAKTFAMPDATGRRRTLKELYVKSLPSGTFHHSVISSTGNQAETYGLALDQLRLLRNTLCHQISTRRIDKATFDDYITQAKDAFTALGQNTTRINEIGKLAEEDFPTARLQQVEDELKREKDAAIKFKQIDDHLIKIESQVEDVGSVLKDVKTEVTHVKTQIEDVRSDVEDATIVKTQVEDVGSDVKDVKTEVTDVKTQVEDVGSDVKDVKTGVTDVKTQVEDVGSDVKDVKTEVTDVKTQVEDVGSDVKDLKTGVTDVKTQVEDVGSDVKDLKTGVTDVKTQVEDVGSDVKALKTGVTDVKTQVEDVGLDVKDLKTGVTDVKTQVEDVGSDVKDVKTEVKGVKTQVEDVGSDMKYVKTGVKDLKTQVEEVGSGVKDVKTGVTDVKTQVEEVGSNVKDVKTGVTDVKTQVEDVGSDVKDVKTGVTDVKTQVEDVGSDVKGMKTQVVDIGSDVEKLKADVVDIKQAIQEERSKGPLLHDSIVRDKIPEFVGRLEECQAILDHLTDGDTRLVDVWGPPGFGKTSVAINVAHNLREMKIPVYFISLCGMKRKDDLVSKLLSIFTDSKQKPHPHISASDWLIQGLRQLTNTFVLMLDNADDLLESGDAKLKEEVLRFTEEILTQCSHIKLLFTTRESLDYLTHKLPIHQEWVGVLDEVSSVSLVQSLLPNVSDEDCSSIVKVCGQVPLAMRLMCSIMREENVSLIELLEELKILPLVELLDTESFPEDARLKTIINKSFERLTGHERDAFVSLVVFPGSFGIEEATAVLDLKTVRQTKKVIQSLERKSLIDCSEDFASFTIHSLLRSFIDQRRTTDKETGAVSLAAQHHFYSYNISIFGEANEKFLTGHSNEAWTDFLCRRENIILALSNGTRDDELYSKTVDILSKAELFLYAILQYEDLFKTIYHTAVNEAQKRKNVDDERKLLAAKSFSHWGWFVSDNATWDHFMQAGFTDSADCPAKLLCYFGIHQVLCGKLDEGISSLKSSVDRLNSSCDETILKQLVYQVLALSHLEKQEDQMASHFVDLFRREAKAGSASVGWVPFNIPKEGWSSVKNDFFLFCATNVLIQSSVIREHENLRGKIQKMKSMRAPVKEFCGGRVESSLKGHLEILKQDVAMGRLFINELKQEELLTDDVVVAFESWYSTVESLIDFQESARNMTFHQVIEEVLNIVESIVSEKVFGQLFSCSIFGSVEQTMKETLDTLTRSCEDDPEIDFETYARSCDMIGKLLDLVNDYSGALEAHEQALQVRKETIGDHVDAVLSLTSIGCLYFKMKNESKAVESFQSALKLRKQLDIYDHPDSANIYFILGENHLTLGNYEKAIEAHLQALELRIKHLGEHPLTGESLHQIAVVYYEKGTHSAATSDNIATKSLQLENFKDALTFCQQALTMRLELLSEHVDTANSFQVLGSIHYWMGDCTSAVEAFQKASDMRSNLLGDHEDTALSYHWLGLAKCNVGDLNKALESLHKALQLRKKHLMGYHPAIANSFNEIGIVYYKMGDYQSAKEQFQNASDLYQKFLYKHKCTANSRHNLAETYHKLGNYPEALKCFQQSLSMRLELLGQNVDTADSFHALGEVHYSMGDLSSAVEAFRKASDMKSDLLGDHEDTALSYHRLGDVQRNMGDLNGALESFQNAFQMRKKCSLGTHPETAENVNEIGLTYYKMGDYHSARGQFQDAVDLFKQLPDKQESTATVCQNLAVTYLATESYPEALDFCQQALSMRLELLGEHVDTANSFYTLGEVHCSMGDFSSAVEAFQKASDMRSNLLGDHEDTALSYHWLGQAECKMGELDKALKSFQKASQVRKKLSLGIHPETADNVNEIGLMYYKMGDYQSARGQFQDAVDLYKQLPDEHEGTATSCENLAVTYLAMKSYPEALDFCQQALSMRLELLGEHVDTANSFYILGEVHCGMGDFSSAVEAFQKASDMRSNLLGDHEDTAQSYHWLGRAECKMGELDKALKSFQKASQMRKKLSLGTHPETAENVNDIGLMYYKMGNYQSAREQFQNAVDLYKQLPDKHKSTATSCHNLAETYRRMGSYQEALEFFQQALTTRLELLGEHVDTAKSFHALGTVHCKMYDFRSAIEALQKASDMRSNLLGDHKHTAKSYHWLGLAQWEMGDLNGALESIQKALQMRKKILGDHPDTAKSQKLLNCVFEALRSNELDCD